ncbi:MAG: hypothetical protein NUV88_02730 [Candidatus Kaiserbacteria bacterium]|nr:hypothetical protein [Candidatus Kaiserbacteria bacterium]
MRELLLMIHPTTGVFAILAALWVFIEALNASASNRARLLWGSVLTAVLMTATLITGGYWYVVYYAADKAIILKSAWPFAHSIIMETKEHLFFATLILSVLLPIIVRGNDLVANRGARILVYVTASLIILSSLAFEGAGAVISMAVRVGLLN